MSESSPRNALPTSLYSSLLLKLVTVLELTQKSEGTVTPQAKQAILHAARSPSFMFVEWGTEQFPIRLTISKTR